MPCRLCCIMRSSDKSRSRHFRLFMECTTSHLLQHCLWHEALLVTLLEVEAPVVQGLVVILLKHLAPQLVHLLTNLLTIPKGMLVQLAIRQLLYAATMLAVHTAAWCT
eukprot:GHRR01034965.1.p1 GENE.GHRR01034965.1~~GHRR01034965.1.p1  ORF type:complete len:108 (-),score=9.14 GHRR01034965.1:2-325(-)